MDTKNKTGTIFSLKWRVKDAIRLLGLQNMPFAITLQVNQKAQPFTKKNIRNHWGVENNLHWSLDVIFQEDACRKRHKNAAQNFSLVNKIALNILKNDKSKNISMRRKRNIASWDMQYLDKLLNF